MVNLPQDQGTHLVDEALLTSRVPSKRVRLRAPTLESAGDFLRACGFDPDSPLEAREVEQYRQLAVTLLEEVILVAGRVPNQVREELDPRKLLVWASLKDERQPWACAVLRVAHAYARSDAFLVPDLTSRTRKQIAQRYEAHLFGEGETRSLGRGEETITIVGLVVEAPQDLTTRVLEMLGAAGRPSHDSFDPLDVRIGLRARADVRSVVEYLDRNGVISFTDVSPCSAKENDGSYLRFIARELVRPDGPGPDQPRVFHPYRVALLERSSFLTASTREGRRRRATRSAIESLRLPHGVLGPRQ
jgi:uncharacterized protein (TIGR04562 family)